MPSLKDLLKKKSYFIILDKDTAHPKKNFFDIVVFELVKDDPFYHEVIYKDIPFFSGLVIFDKDPEKEKLVPFKFWKRLTKERRDMQGQFQLKSIDPTSFRYFILYAKFVILGNHLNRPVGYKFDQHQVVETDAHAVQEHQMQEYLTKLSPLYEYCESLHYTDIRNYLFCHTCKQEDHKYTLIDEATRYKNLAFFVCARCAGKEIIHSLKQRMEVTSTLKTYIRDLLKNYRDVVKVLNVFNPNFNILEHREATLVGVKKKKITTKSLSPISVYDLDLPLPLQQYYASRSRINLLPAQIMAVEHGLLENQDEIIVSATSSGKTMIGEMAGISKILRDKFSQLQSQGVSNPFQKRKSSSNPNYKQEFQFSKKEREFLTRCSRTQSKAKMLYIVPIVALANMRYREYKGLKIYGVNPVLKVGVSHFGKKKRKRGEFGNFNTADVIIATYEAIDIMLRSGHPYLLKNVRTVVVDEIQMLADEGRGFLLDGLIARLRLYLPRAQMLYLSATISDPKTLAQLLHATLIHYQDRPVPLERHLVICAEEQTKLKNMRLLVREEFKLKSSFGFRGQSIVFTNSRKNTEQLADFLRENHISAYAYHGGLDHSQRKFIEKSFEMQKCSCVVTTAALAAGVDFPASLVIFFNLSMGIKELTVAEFEQMSGRAGRLKKHDEGKVFLLIIPGKSATAQGIPEEQLAVHLLKGDVEPLRLPPNQDAQFLEALAAIAMYSSWTDRDHGIKRSDLQYYHLMLYNGDYDLQFALHYLQTEKMIRQLRNNSVLQTTRFGQAVAESFFSLEQAIGIRQALLQEVNEENPASQMLDLAQTLHSFNNVYVTNRVLADMSVKNQRPSRSNNLFSGAVLSLTSAENLGKKRRGHISRRLYSVLIRWSEDIFNCQCEDSPYCDCGQHNVIRILLDYRLGGLALTDIIETMKEEYEIKIFKGDLLDYFEAIIYSLFAIQKIGRTLPIPPQTMLKVREIPRIVSSLIDTKYNA